jgi:outer membrane receptor protein involved in Fe transport
MKAVCRIAFAALLSAAAAPSAGAQQPAPAKPSPAATPAQKPDAKPDPKAEQNPDAPQKYEETVVVSASRTEEKLVNAPATMTVIGPQTLQSAPTQNFAELLRAVPGVNIAQVSARDINVTTRGATGTLATGQLALLDGRSLYQDFFGFVMWDFLPVNLNEIKQVEVIRGPASAVWGANAVNGVVNVITKSPREMQGTTAVLGVGGFDRSAGASAGEGAGTMFYVNGTHAQAVNDRVAFKISAGGYTQDPYARPTGKIPCDRAEVCTVTTAQYPGYSNTGSTQPKFDARVDYDLPDGKHWSFAGGVAGTDGVMHTGIGPFDINSGSVMGYGKVNFSQKGFKAAFFTNALSGDALNLLSIDATTLKPVTFDFSTRTVDFEASNVQTFNAKHVVTYGGNLRFNGFDLSLAPQAENRTEGGGYLQDEIFLNKTFRLVAGARVDRFDYLDNFVFSPRVSFMIKPQENQTFRVSYNRAYRSPSVINNFLNVTLAQPIDLTPFAGLNPAVKGVIYPLPVASVGNADLNQTSLDAYELSYTGAILQGRAIVSAAFYVNRTSDDIFFTEVKSARYTATNPPPNWAFGLLPPQVIAAVPGGSLPAKFTYENFGETTQKGLELGVDGSVNRNVNVFVNYSFQADPTVNFDLSEVNLPAKNRFNAGLNFTKDRYLGNLTVSYSDSAFWQDVLNDPYHGTTKAYTMVNGGFGVKWAHNRLTTSLKATNIGNQEIQQHVFGDIIKRSVVGELRVNF